MAMICNRVIYEHHIDGHPHIKQEFSVAYSLVDGEFSVQDVILIHTVISTGTARMVFDPAPADSNEASQWVIQLLADDEAFAEAVEKVCREAVEHD